MQAVYLWSYAWPQRVIFIYSDQPLEEASFLGTDAIWDTVKSLRDSGS